MELEIDYWFVFLCTILLLLILGDIILTLIGLSKGLAEGNPLVVYIFSKIGINIGISLIGIGLVCCVVCLAYLQHKIKYKWLRKTLYYVVFGLIIIRAYVVIEWIYIIQEVV